MLDQTRHEGMSCRDGTGGHVRHIAHRSGIRRRSEQHAEVERQRFGRHVESVQVRCHKRVHAALQRAGLRAT